VQLILRTMRQASVAVSVAVALLVASHSLAAQGGPPRDPREMTFSSLTFSPPKAKRTVLDNGMALYLLEDHELPLFRVRPARWVWLILRERS
jgi:hypothetical protein